MNVTIIHSIRGRLRVVYPKGCYSKHQIELAKTLLGSQEEVMSIRHSPAARSLCISYLATVDQCVIESYLNALDEKYLNDIDLLDAVVIREVSTTLLYALSKLFLKHYAKRWFLPIPILHLISYVNIAPRIWKGYCAIRQGHFCTSETLDTIALLGSLVTGDLQTARTIHFLLQVGDLVEEHTRRESYESLTDTLLTTDTPIHIVTPDGQELTISRNALQVGQHIILRSGELISADSVVIYGEGSVNQANITGESLPLYRKAGDSLYAGTLLEEGEIVAEVRAVGQQTKMNAIFRLIDQSQNLKANAQKRAERLADKLVPYNFMLAIATFLFTRSVTKALSTLMVDYSCAMKLAAPITILTGMRQVAAKGVIVKGGKFLELTAQAKTLIVDKTGTLTEAIPEVVKVLTFDGVSEKSVLRIAACLEEHFPHSLARAVVAAAEKQHLKHKEIHTKVEYVVAHGIASSVDGKRILIGSQHFIFEDEGVPRETDNPTALCEIESMGHSLLYIAYDQKLIGVVAIHDPIRPTVPNAIRDLRKLGVTHIHMITGDSESTAARIAHALDLDAYTSQALPEEKVSLVKAYRSNGDDVMMVGDGMNDAPALAAASVGIAMGGAAGLTNDVADLVLPEQGFDALVETRQVSQAMLQRITLNNWIIVGVNSALILFGLGGVLTGASAAFLHNVTTVGVAITATRPICPRKK